MLCAPSRGSIMSGLYPHVHGAQTNKFPVRHDVKFLAEYLHSLTDDPYEQHNRIAKPAQDARIRDMLERLRA